jgi:hypothetical protein
MRQPVAVSIYKGLFLMLPKSLWILGIAAAASLLIGCDKLKISPKLINADGVPYAACKGLVWTSKINGMFSDSAEFKVTFTDLSGREYTIWGVSKLTISDPQEEDYAPFPRVVPDVSLAVDVDGKVYVNGQIYTWPDGSKAKLTDGKWQPVKVSTACQ